jgi:MscS family membrane protein
MSRLYGVLLLLSGLLMLPMATGQALPKMPTAAPAPTAPKPEILADPLGRTTPYGTVVGFLDFATKGDYKTAARYLDSRLPLVEKERLASQLKLVIDRGLNIDPSTVSRDPQGELPDDGRPTTQALLGSVHAGPNSLDIVLDRVPRGNGAPVWLFSANTLKEISEFSEEMKPSWFDVYIAPNLPDSFQRTSFLSLPLARWVQILTLLLVGVIGTWLLSKLAVQAFERSHRLVNREATSARELGMVRPLQFIALLVVVFMLSRLSVTFLGRQVLAMVQHVLVIVGLAWLAMRITDAVCDLAVQRSRRAAQTGRLAVIQLARGTTKALLVLAGMLFVLSGAGVNLSTVVAGLGIGGVAVAFAAQKTIENLFGTVTFVTDQPARVGDFCRIGDFTGTIESVGMRSSRIRTIEDTVLTVPNGQLSTMTLDNISARGKILFHHMLGLSYSTTSDQMGAVLEGIEKLLREHQRIEGSSFRVRLLRFGTSSLDVELFAYVLTRDWREFLAIQQGLLVRILQIVEASGTSIAFPTQTLHVANQPPGS